MLHNQRESDGDVFPPTHPSYTNRPKVELQLASAACRLEGVRGAQLGTVNDYVPPVVPPTHDSLFAPDNQLSDWGGMVRKDDLGKKLFSGHSSQASGIEQTENGFVSLSAPQEWGRKKIPTETSKVLRYGSPGIIGGISSENRWETESSRFSSGAGTRRDQLSMSKQAVPRTRMPVPGMADRLQGPPSYYSNQPTPRDDGGDGGVGEWSVDAQQSLIGYRAPAQTKSLLQNMAASIADQVAEDFRPQKSAAASDSNGAHSKQGVAIPGYTGNRLMRR